MTAATIIKKWDAEATDRTNNAALASCSALNSTRLRNLFASADVATAVEFYTEDTDEELFDFAKEGDDLAAWALLVRSLPQTEMFSRRNGSLNIVIDEDDVSQMIAEAFFDRLSSEDNYADFRARFLSDSRHTAQEAQRFSTDFTAPPLELAQVRRVLKECDGDTALAFETYQARTHATRKMTWDRFFSLVELLAPAGVVRLDEQTETGDRSVADTVADPAAEAEFAAILGDYFDTDDVEAAWATLTELQREVVSRRLGLFNGAPETAVAIAAALGVSQPSVSITFKRAVQNLHKRIQPRGNTQCSTKEHTDRTPKAPVEPAEKTPVFPVHTRSITDPAPTEGLTAVELRALPHEGISNPLRLRSRIRENRPSWVQPGNLAWPSTQWR